MLHVAGSTATLYDTSFDNPPSKPPHVAPLSSGSWCFV